MTATQIGLNGLVGRVTVLASLGLYLTMLSALAVDSDQRVFKTTTAGQPVVVGGHMRRTRDCQSREPPQIRVTIPPDHGTLCTKRELMYPVAGLNRAAIEACKGQKLLGVNVLYQSTRAFEGSEVFQYEIDYGEVEGIGRFVQKWKVSVTVTAGAASAFQGQPGIAGPVQQQSGPVPPCIAAIS